MINIVCNGQQRQVAPEATVADLLQELGLPAQTVVVEHNGMILTLESYAAKVLAEGDKLELIRFVGGG